MKEYHLLRIIQTMSKADIRQARKYLKADYFKQSPLALLLFNQLLRFHPDMNGELIEEQKLFSEIFPGEAFAEPKWRRLRSELKTGLEDFLAFQNWRSDSLRYQQDLGEAFRRRNDSVLFESAQLKAIQHLGAKTPDGIDRKLELMNLYRQLYFDPHISKLDAKQRDRWFAEMVSNTEQSFLLAIWQMACEMKIRNRTNKSIADSFLLQSADAMLELETIPSSPLIHLYAALYRSFLDLPGLDQFEQMKTEIIDLHRKGKTAFYNLALAYKILINQLEQLVKKEASASHLLFSLYEQGIQSGLYLEQGQLSYNRFLNITIRMLLTRDLARAKKFISQFQTQLSKNEREPAVNLAEAYWYYYSYLEHQDQESLQEAWLRTLFVTKRQLPFEVRFRSIRLRILFEQFLSKTTDRSVLQNEIRNFQHFLKARRDFTRRQSYSRLVHWIQKLATWKNKNHPSLSQLKSYQIQIVAESEPIELKSWLLSKIKSMAEFGK